MLDRDYLKRQAKLTLRQNGWGTAIWVCFLIGILAGGPSGTSTFSYRINSFSSRWGRDFYPTEYARAFTAFMASLGIVAFLLALGYALFVANPILVGKARFFMERRERNTGSGVMFSAFSSHYLNTVEVMFVRGAVIFLWSLLLLIPGIIKSYQYFFVPYIMAENPSLDRKRAFELSKAMTDGRKFDIFILELSFIGWALLCVFTFGIGFLFLNPYQEATFAELYAMLRIQMLEDGYAMAEELPGFSK